MRCIVVLFLLSLPVLAAERNWQDAQVVPTTTLSYFWLKTSDYTYMIPNKSKGSFVEWWLHLTIGGTAKFSPDANGKTAHLVDDAGKQLTVRITQRLANGAMTEANMRAFERMVAAQQQWNREAEPQREAARLRVLDNLKTPPLRMPPLPSQSIHCTSHSLGDTVRTDCDLGGPYPSAAAEIR